MKETFPEERWNLRRALTKPRVLQTDSPNQGSWKVI